VARIKSVFRTPLETLPTNIESENQSVASALVNPDRITPQYLPDPKLEPINRMLFFPVLDPWFCTKATDTDLRSMEYIWVLEVTNIPTVTPTQEQILKAEESLLLITVSDNQSVTEFTEPRLLAFGEYLSAPKPDPTMEKVAPKTTRVLHRFEFDMLTRSNEVKPDTLPTLPPHDNGTNELAPNPEPAFTTINVSEAHTVPCPAVKPYRPLKVNQPEPNLTPKKLENKKPEEYLFTGE
jgi:hypothetical protein